MTRKAGLFAGEITVARSATALLAAESGTLTDANYPPATVGVLDCTGYDTILVGVDITAGTAPTMTIEALFRDDDAADGTRWKRLLLGAPPGVTATALTNETTGALASNVNMQELRVFGHKQVLLRISAVTNATNTTAWKILAHPGKTRELRR